MIQMFSKVPVSMSASCDMEVTLDLVALQAAVDAT